MQEETAGTGAFASRLTYHAIVIVSIEDAEHKRTGKVWVMAVRTNRMDGWRMTGGAMDSRGALQAGVFDETVGRPVESAEVSVYQRNADGSLVQLEEMTCDASGQTAAVEVATPPEEYSMAPDFPKPYSEYSVRVRADGFVPLQIDGVQVFAGQLAVQKVNMQPEPEMQSMARAGGQPEGRRVPSAVRDISRASVQATAMAQASRQIMIKEHTLWGDFPPKIPEEEVKPLNPPTGFVVLDQPVVPETIVVHDGALSNTSAPNYYVPFKDYIKNVASSEIYATWPDATIRSNVLAIISFTLNRVFTEWYRNKGRNFTITSSTAYDHAFFYGRNIYENISQIVDEMFSTYITRPGIRQPLLAQYCDGNKSSCPNWMTQWGSKNLGDQGYTATQILRHFYGSEVYLTQAVKVTGIPASFPGNNLQTGASGSDVRKIQEQLNAISNNYPAIQKIVVDGVFGSQTDAAVRKFQEVFRLPVSGIVDFPTWYRISDIYVAVTRMAELR